MLELAPATTPDAPAERARKDARASRTPRWHPARLPLRYLAIAAGSGLLLIGGEAGMWLRFVRPLGLVATAATLLGMAVLLLAASRRRLSTRWTRRFERLRRPALAGTLLLVVLWVLTLAGVTYGAFFTPLSQAYGNDVIAFTHANAELVVAGRNPYTADDVFPDVVRRFPSGGSTPLRRGAFGEGYEYPSPQRLWAVEREYLAAPPGTRDELDPRTLHSYPALSFLLYVPLIAAGVPNILVLHIALYWALFAALLWQAPGALRPAAALVAGTTALIPRYSLTVDTEIVCMVVLLAAWHWRDRRWLSPVLLGLASAFKQYSWFFAPFFLLDALRTHGWRVALRRGLVTVAVFLLPNLPYIVVSPGAWVQSMFLPMSEPLFPLGAGIITLSMGHLLPYFPPVLYATLEAAALLGALAAFARWHAVLRECALLLALVPLLFAFRSPQDYFAFAPWLALYAANRVYAVRQEVRASGERAGLAA